MRLSDSGLPVSSSLMSLRILARTAVEDAPPPSAASTWLEKKYLSSNTPRGVCMYLLDVTREMVDSCMSMACGDVLEDHRPHAFLAVLEERGLALDDAACHFHEGFVADFQALEQPARFLQLGAHGRMSGAAAEHVGVTLVEAHARQRGAVHLDGPAAIGAAHEDVGHHVFGLGAADGGARARMTAAHQRDGLRQFVVGSGQLAAQQRELAIGELVEMFVGDGQREAQPGRVGMQRAQLQREAFAQRARGDARRIERLHEPQHALDFGRRRR